MTYTDQHKTKATGIVMNNRYLGNMKRSISFDVFGGLAKFVQTTLEGNSEALSPEDFIAEITGGVAQYKNAGANRVWDANKNAFVRDLRIKNKLYYFAQGKRQQRALIQPYMRYYFQKVMLPLARKLIRDK